jgi:hypothetical protein
LGAFSIGFLRAVALDEEPTGSGRLRKGALSVLRPLAFEPSGIAEGSFSGDPFADEVAGSRKAKPKARKREGGEEAVRRLGAVARLGMRGFGRNERLTTRHWP